MRALLLAVVIAGCSRETATTAGSSTTPSAAPITAPAEDAAPDAVTHASPVYEDAGTIALAGSVDGASLRARNRARLAKDVSPVTVLRGDGPRELGERICEAVVPKRPASTPVLLKPNLGGFDWFKDPAKNNGDDGLRGRITQPEFVRGVIHCLKKRGHTKITVAEGWGATHKDWLKLVEVSGYAAMTKSEDVPLVAMDDDGVFDKTKGEPGKPLSVSGMEKTHVPTLLMPKLLAEHLEHGLFISLPKVKAHRFGVVSVSVKGMQGTVMLSDASPAFRQKWRMHRELNRWLDGRKKGPVGEGPHASGSEDRDLYVSALESFAERIADVLEVEAPHVVLADASPAMGGDGFQKLMPTAELLAIGGTNAIRVDQVAARFLGLWDNAALGKELKGHRTSPLITTAAKRFGVDLGKVEVAGDGASVLEGPRPVHFVGMAPFQIHSDAPPVEAPAPSSSLPVAHAAPLGGAKISVDGDASDPAWARATKSTWTSDFAGEETGVRTDARFVWSEGALFALFELEGAGLYTDTSKPVDLEREKLWAEDCVEIFLDTTLGSPKSYHEIELGPFGHFLDLAVDGKKSDVAWSSGLTVGTKRANGRATIEAMLTAKELVSAFKPGARFPLGLFRMEGKGERKYLAWSPPQKNATTKKPNFHVPEAFGALVLDAP